MTVICLDTSKSVWSYSSEIIKFDDIEFMCKDFLADCNIDNDMTDEELQKIHILAYLSVWDMTEGR